MNKINATGGKNMSFKGKGKGYTCWLNELDWGGSHALTSIKQIKIKPISASRLRNQHLRTASYKQPTNLFPNEANA